MHLMQTPAYAEGVRITRAERGKVIGRAYLYIMHNDLHPEPFGFMEDVFVDPDHRGRGIGEALVKKVIALAKKRGCYKLVATSRHGRTKVHGMYRKLGFGTRGTEFRIDFKTD